MLRTELSGEAAAVAVKDGVVGGGGAAVEVAEEAPVCVRMCVCVCE